MGIMETLSDMKRRRLNEDWRDTAREYANSKTVKDFHVQRLNSLDYKLSTKYGDWNVKISFETDNIRVTVDGKQYIGSNWFNTGSEVKAFLFDGGLRDKIYKSIRQNLASKLNSDSLTSDEMKKLLVDAEKQVNMLQNEIDLKIDEEELDKKLHRYSLYSKAMSRRNRDRSNLRWQASREFEKQHELEVGDIVYGKKNSNLRSGKEYVIKSISEPTSGRKVYTVVPENGRGQTYNVSRNEIIQSSDQVSAAIENPDDPKYNKFDQQKYMMNRYSNTDDNEFNEAVKLLNSQGLLVEDKE